MELALYNEVRRDQFLNHTYAFDGDHVHRRGRRAPSNKHHLRILGVLVALGSQLK